MTEASTAPAMISLEESINDKKRLLHKVFSGSLMVFRRDLDPASDAALLYEDHIGLLPHDSEMMIVLQIQWKHTIEVVQNIRNLLIIVMQMVKWNMGSSHTALC
jgi:hypothetical protein